MTLTQVERLLAVDPEGAKQLLTDAKGDSVNALQELRALVRGIRPPILADRGLAETLRSMASSLPLETRVSATLSSRPVAAVESALYFAAAALITNAAKHSAGARIDVDIAEDADMWRITVVDDGIGGAEEGGKPDGGLAGIQRRLDPFDGVLTMVSPVGGGTTATVIVPKPRN